jgi:membrane protein
LVYGREAAEGNIVLSISGVVGSSTAQFVQGLVESASQPRAGLIAAVVGVAGIVVGSAGLFFQLKDALNTVWEVAPKPGYRLVDTIRNNGLSFVMVLGLGVLVLVSLLLTTGVNAVSSFLGRTLPGSETVWRLADFGLSFGLATLLFASIFKVLPDVRIPWSDVWPGAILTALLIDVAQVVLGLIIRLANPGLAFGAAGALVVILIWVNLASLILLFGAEFVSVYSKRLGSRAQPKENAEALTAEARAVQGTPPFPVKPIALQDCFAHSERDLPPAPESPDFAPGERMLPSSTLAQT